MDGPMSTATRAQVVEAIERLGVVAVIRLKEPEKVRAVIDALAAGGIRALEITMTVPGAIDMIGRIAPTLPDGFLIGAGTVLDAETATAAVRAGAQFIVSPVCRASVIDAAHHAGAAVMPGCHRAPQRTEVQAVGRVGRGAGVKRHLGDEELGLFERVGFLLVSGLGAL